MNINFSFSFTDLKLIFSFNALRDVGFLRQLLVYKHTTTVAGTDDE